jgi:hypothetical protein
VLTAVCARQGCRATDYYYYYLLSQYSDWLRTGRPGFDHRQRRRNFSLPSAPSPLWGPPSLLYSRYGDSFPEGKCGRGVMLTSHPLLVPRLRMRGAASPPPKRLSWRIVGHLFFTLIVATVSHPQKYSYML